MKILYVTTIGATMGFFIPFITCLVNDGHTVDIATNCKDSKVPKVYKKLGCKVYAITTSRNPLDRGNVKAYRRLKHMVYNGSYDIIHCHTPVAGVLTRLAARNARKKGSKVFYTAHGFHFYSGAPVKNWLLYYPIEWICSWLTDILITINKEDYKRAKKHLHAKRIEYVPGVGVDTEKFVPSPSGREKIRKDLGIPKDRVILLSVGELNSNKNHESVIRAIQGLDFTYIVVGEGGLADQLKTIAKNLDVDLRLQGFRSDVSNFYDAADIYVLPSIREGLNVSLMEAMASGLPCAVGDTRGNVDLITEPIFKPTDINEIKYAIEEAIINKKVLGQKNRKKIRSFDIRNVEKIVCEIYRGGGKQYRHLIDLISYQNKRKEIGVPFDAFLLISVGELNENKNHQVIIKAVAKAGNAKVHYAIAGQGILRESLLEIAEKLKISSQIHLLDFRTDVPDLYAVADVCVFPSIREGLGLAAIEGMASGLPLLVSDNRGLRRIVSKKNGIVCECDDINGFAKGINFLFSNQDMAINFGRENIRQSINFDIKMVNGVMKHIYFLNRDKRNIYKDDIDT